MTCLKISLPVPLVPASLMKTQTSDPSTWMRAGSPSSSFHFIPRTLTVIYSKPQTVYCLSRSLLMWKWRWKAGIGADSKAAMTIETLVNESVIVSPLFNVKKNLWYIIFKVLHLIWVFYHSLSIHTHTMEDLGSSDQYVNEFCLIDVTPLRPSKQDATCFQNQIVGFLRRSMCPLYASHTSTCLSLSYFLYIFLNICIYLVHRR